MLPDRNVHLDDFLQELCDVPGVSGQEGGVRDFLARTMTQFGIVQNVGGSLVVHLEPRCSGPTVVVAAHMDTVGLIVKAVMDGLVYIEPSGGIDPRLLPGKIVTVRTRGGEGVRCIVDYGPFHLLSEDDRKKAFGWGDMRLRPLGKVDAIAVGDPVTIGSPLIMEGGWLVSTALDDRLGCWFVARLMAEAAKAAKTDPTPRNLNLVGVFTVEEELGTRGAERVVPFLIKEFDPALFIALDVTSATIGAMSVKKEEHSPVGTDGPVISWRDAGAVYDERAVRVAIDATSSHVIPHYTRVAGKGATDGLKFGQVAGGRRTLSLSVPSLGIHGPAMAVKREAAENTYRLAGDLLATPWIRQLLGRS